ncbi:hypothetical protein EDB80DRAFT_574549 [Ilyonectria destructans]|nr:hypothetical protein EDB80DRAFT_574549 [Ilyonectria destructans]
MTNDKYKSSQTIKSEPPQEKPKIGWKPISLSTPILSGVIFITIILAGAIETLAQRSAARGGLALSPSLNEIPKTINLSYLYGPTTIAVLYSIIWSWIDLDAKRMQPWFELSKPKGATGEDSIFLDYQYDFVASVPFKSARRKHWLVFFAGTSMVIVFWLLTPLQSALMGTSIVAQTEQATISIRSQLRPLREQEALITPHFLTTAYAIEWLGQPYPQFATSKYALLPFYLEDDPAPVSVASNWTAATTKFTTELSCWPAEHEVSFFKGTISYDFFNGQGCNASVGFTTYGNYSMIYVGYAPSDYSQFALESPSCPKTANSTHQFLAIWAAEIDGPHLDSGNPDFNITAIFCQPQYYKQQVLVTLESADLKPIDDSIQALSPRELLTEEEFNSTAFEYLLANGMSEIDITRDYPFNSVIEQLALLENATLSRPISNMVGFALAGQSAPLVDYSSPTKLASIYHDAHQHLFSVAIDDLLTNTTTMTNRTASVDFFLYGVVVSRVFATTVECLLGVVAVFTALVLWFSRTALSNLPMNPSTLGRYLDVFRHSPELLHSFRSMDNTNEKYLLEQFQKDEFQLFYDRSSKRTHVTIDKTQSDVPKSIEENLKPQKGYYEPVKPWVLRRWTGSLFIIVLVAGIAGLSYLKMQEKKLGGLQRPSENFEVLQLLTNYVPTIFATLIEPLWVLLNRMLCVLQPFKDLWEGSARSSVSMDATYTSVPPQLVLWRAIKSRHFILALVCVMALLANVLAVGLGSLFNEAPTTATYQEVIQPAFAPRFDNDTIYDFAAYLYDNNNDAPKYQNHFYVAMANMVSGTALPPWVSKDYFFQRYDLPDSDKIAVGDTYNVTSRGFGLNGNCTAISAFEVPDDLDYQWRDGTCPNLIERAAGRMRDASQRDGQEGPAGIECVFTASGSTIPEICDVPLTMGWARSADLNDDDEPMEASFVLCEPIFETAMFNLTIDSSGHVLSYQKTSDLETTLGYAESKDHTDVMIENYNHQWDVYAPDWHNDMVSRDWMNYFIFLSTGSRDALDPTLSTPDPEELRPVVEDIYRRLFPIFLSLNEHFLDHTNMGRSITATRSTKETRIFMEEISFIITIVILGMNTVVAMIFYIRAVAFVLPRMPTTLGSILAYIAPSRLASPTLKPAKDKESRTFSFGRYIGVDGDVHIGVEMDPYVVRVDPASLRSGNGFFNRMRTRFFPPTHEPVRSGPWI